MNDAELAAAFAGEAEPHFHALESGLVRLEAGLDPDLIAELFRHAHTVKGAAAAVGFDDVGAVAQIMEDLLDEVRAGIRPVSATLVDTLRNGVDGLRAMITARGGGGDLTTLALEQRADLEVFERPLAPAVLRCVVVRSGGQDYAITVNAIAQIVPGEDSCRMGAAGEPVEVVDLGERLGDQASARDPSGRPAASGPVIVVNGIGGQYGFAVDALLGLRDVVPRPLPPLVPPNPVLAGISIEPDGSLLCVLDSAALMEQARTQRPCR